MISSPSPNTDKYLKDNQARFLEELCEYLRYPSVSAQPAHASDMISCATWLVEHCREIGLESQCHTTNGHPVVTAKTPRRAAKGKRPHFVVYGHYDVQPPEPLDLWDTPPFEPSIRKGLLFARGSADNKGQHFAHLKGVEAWLKTGAELPCDLTFLIEGEEEVGSKNLSPFLKQHASTLRCDAVVISDTGIPSLKHPALTYSLRGIVAMEVILRGPDRDLHSGLYGGTVDNPAMALSRMLAILRDEQGRVAIPHFYDDVLELDAYEKQLLARAPFDEGAYRKLLGVPRLFGEMGFTPEEQRSTRPTVEINGLTSGYQGEGSKTIIPSWARAKLTFRLVPDQNPDRIVKAVTAHLKKICPPTVRMEIKTGHGGDPYLVTPRGPKPQAALKALHMAFGCEPILMREGGSIPILTEIKRHLKADSLLMGLALPEANAHSPNESFSLEAFRRGMKLSACLWPLLTDAVLGR